MRVGNLTQAPVRSRSVAAFQLLRVFLVMVFAAVGGFALSLSVDKQEAEQEDVAALDSTGDPQPDQAAPVQVADATAAESMPVGMTVTTASQAPVQESVHAPAMSDANAVQDMASPAPVSSDAPMPATEQAAAEPSQPEMTGTVNVANNAPDPAPDSSLVDLNTASFEELNRLRNVGALGRAIIKGRPYASAEDLVKRKVVRRAVYEKIKDQVTVR